MLGFVPQPNLRMAFATPSCGGGGGNGSEGAGDGSPRVTQDAKVARIEIVPGSAMLTGIGQTRRLEAKAFNAAGEELSTPALAWQSSHPDQVEINAQGVITARSHGSSEIKAATNGVSSPSAIVLLGVNKMRRKVP